MASMIVISTTAIPDHVRGALTRWLLEPNPGLYVGTVSARIRDELWEILTETVGDGAATLIHPTNNEQGFQIHTTGTRRRRPITIEGLTLIAFQPTQAASNETATTT